MIGTKINLDANIIAREARNTETLLKGELLHSKNAITDITYFADKLNFRGTVNDRGTYHSAVLRVNLSGDLMQYRCTCNEFTTYSRACPHIVAMMKMIYDNLYEINNMLKSFDRVITICQNGVLKKPVAPEPALVSNRINTLSPSTKKLTKPVDPKRGSVIEFTQMKLDIQEFKPLKLDSNSTHL